MRQTSELELFMEYGTPLLLIDEWKIGAYQDGVIAFDFQNQVVAANEAMMMMVPGEWNTELPCYIELVLPSMSEEFEWMHRMVRERVLLRNHVFNITRQGKLCTLLADSYFLRNKAGEQVGIVLFLKDIGNLVSLEKQLQHNEKLATVGKIAAGVAHEIRNPLTSVKGFLQMMRTELERNGMYKEQNFTTVMLDEIERINGLVKELLLLSKPRELKMEFIDLRELLGAMVPLVESESNLHNIQFELLTEEMPLVHADRELLKQVFLNLVKNAIEAMEETDGGQLRVRTQFDAEKFEVRVHVQDSGPGIPHYMMDRIFDAFFTTKETGIGLGLPICQRLVNDVGGKLTVMSKGYGTTVTVQLPVAK